MKQRKGIKEFFRKIMVSLKRRPHNIPLIMLAVTYIVYSFNFENISYTTALIGRFPMGLCTFVVMLFSLLGIVSFMNAFPARQKPKIPMVIIFYVIQALVLATTIVYIVTLENALIDTPAFLQKDGAAEILSAEAALFAHVILLVVSTALVALIPVLQKLFNLVKTSVDVEAGKEVNIDISNE